MSNIKNNDILPKTTPDLDKVGKETLIALLSSNTKDQAAELLGITRKALYLRQQKYDLAPYLASVPQQALQALQMGSVKAANNVVTLVGNRDLGISLQASKDILDRVGLGRNENTGNNFQVNILNNIEKDKTSYKFDSP